MRLIFSSWLALLSKNSIFPLFFFFFRDWIVGDVMCKIFPLLFYGNTAATLFNIAAVTMNRWHEFIFNKYQLLTTCFHEFLISNLEFLNFIELVQLFLSKSEWEFWLIICAFVCFCRNNIIVFLKQLWEFGFSDFGIGNSWNYVVSNSVVLISCNFD